MMFRGDVEEAFGSSPLRADGEPVSASAPGKILVADDDRGMLRMLEVVLSSRGYTVKTAENGASAIEALRQEPFDMVLSDIDMPEVCGNALAKYCRQFLGALPVIALTGHPEKAGPFFDRVLGKPIDPDSLIRNLERFRGRR